MSLLDNLSISRQLILYILMASLARGVLLPDFRYNLLSIILIQVAFPIALFAPMLLKVHGDNFWSYYLICVSGISVAALLALVRFYFSSVQGNTIDQVSVAVFILSYIAQIGLYSALFIFLFMATKFKGIY